jgi:uncharacterized cupin superfamily protein
VSFVSVNALTTALEPDPETEPATASAVLGRVGELELGVWEMAPGTATDTEVDEVFVVLAGRATVTGIGDEPVELEPGVVVRLAAGMQTTWTVHETLRKVYLA